VGAFAIICWGVITSFFYFYCLKKVNKFRVGYIYEITGMDVLMHGGTNLLTNDMINKIEARQRSIANANRMTENPFDYQ
jgi:ammonia channel protein AmtB